MQKFFDAVFLFARPAIRRVLGAVLDAAQEQALAEAETFSRTQDNWTAEQRRAAVQTARQAVEYVRAKIDEQLGS
jgi:hypothetical protein